MRDAYRIASIMLRDPSVLASLVVGCVVLVPVCVLWARRCGWSWPRVSAAGLAGIGLSAMLALTWGRWIEYHPEVRWRGCLTGSALGLLDGEAILNWVVLMPAGFFAMLAIQRFGVVAVLVLAVPVLVEVAQSLVALGTCQIVDLLRNSGGALAAAAVAAVLLASARRLRPAAR